MQITLRNKTYTASHLTDLNYLALAAVCLDENGSFSLEGIDNFEQLSPKEKFRVMQPMMKQLVDPDVKASLAQSLSSIFPDLPKDLVSYEGKGKFKLNLTLVEICELIVGCSNELQKKQAPVVKEVAPVIDYDYDAKISEIQKQLDSLQKQKGKVQI